MSPRAAISPKIGGTGSGRVDPVAHVGVQAQEVEQPVAGDVGQAAHVHARTPAGRAPRARRSRWARAARRRRCARPARAAPRRGRSARCARACSRWSARRSRAARSRRRRARAAAPVTTASRSTSPTHMPTRSRPPGEGCPRISSGTTASSPPGISTPGVLGARLEAPARRASSTSSPDLLDGDVVEHRDRVGAHADHVVHVHRDAVDAHGVEAAELLGHDQLGAHAVGRQGQPRVARQAQDAGVVARAQHASAARGRCRSCAARPPARRRPRPASPVSTPARAYAESAIAVIQPQGVVGGGLLSAAARPAPRRRRSGRRPTCAPARAPAGPPPAAACRPRPRRPRHRPGAPGRTSRPRGAPPRARR